MAKEVKIYRVLGFYRNDLFNYDELIANYKKVGITKSTIPQIMRDAPVLDGLLGPFLGPALDEIHYHTQAWNDHFGG